MNELKSYVEFRIEEYEKIVEISSGTAKRIADLALGDLKRILSAIIQEEEAKCEN